MPVHKVKGGFQWGHQKVYPTRAAAQRQAAAIYASGYKGGDAQPKGRFVRPGAHGKGSWVGKDAEFNEADHPRGQPGNAGQFGSGGSTSSSPTAKKEAKAVTEHLFYYGGFSDQQGTKKGVATLTGGKYGSRAGWVVKIDREGRWQLISPDGTVKEGHGLKAIEELMPSPKAVVEDPKDKGQFETLMDARPPADDNTMDAVGAYQGPGYLKINSGLRSGKISSQAKKIKAWLDTASLPFDMTVYRGVNDSGREISTGAAASLSSLSVGDVYEDKGFVSTSVQEDFAKQWSDDGVLLKINVKKGHKASMIGAMENAGLAEVEQEILLQAGGKYRVISKTDGVIEVEAL